MNFWNCNAMLAWNQTMFPNPLAAAASAVLGSLAAVELGALAMWYACSHPRSQWMAPSLVRGGGRRLALTFDDGPLPPYTGRILDVLAREAVAATFFVCGSNAELYPETLKRIAADGHAIGNHTYTHPYLFFMSTRNIAAEIERTQDVVERAIGKAPVLFRPPYGGRWFGLRRVLRERHLQLVMWSDYHDAAPDPSAMPADVLHSLAPGMILH